MFAFAINLPWFQVQKSIVEVKNDILYDILHYYLKKYCFWESSEDERYSVETVELAWRIKLTVLDIFNLGGLIHFIASDLEIQAKAR